MLATLIIICCLLSVITAASLWLCYQVVKNIDTCIKGIIEDTHQGIRRIFSKTIRESVLDNPTFLCNQVSCASMETKQLILETYISEVDGWVVMTVADYKAEQTSQE